MISIPNFKLDSSKYDRQPSIEKAIDKMVDRLMHEVYTEPLSSAVAKLALYGDRTAEHLTESEKFAVCAAAGVPTVTDPVTCKIKTAAKCAVTVIDGKFQVAWRKNFFRTD